ncbi:hypothetical protein [Raoultibacter phocaeensis]|uniref:hypothetical protein n=1 Tax=Raoultibacter phocaeensis TaxID=2479841 RepID=UPI00111A8492|nr:hypothetical protein [Raoultibacter phocaeensis]
MDEVSCWIEQGSFATMRSYPVGKKGECCGYILGEREKRKLRAEGIEVTSVIANAINEYSWGCLSAMEEIATVVPIDQSDFWLASKYKPIHADFEDDLVLAAVERSKADFLVTADEVLLRRSPVAALSPSDLLALIKA